MESDGFLHATSSYPQLVKSSPHPKSFFPNTRFLNFPFISA